MSPKLVETTSALHSEQQNHLSFFTKQVTSTQNTGMRSRQSRAMCRAKEFEQYERKGFTRWFLYSGTVVRSHCYHIRAFCPREEMSLLSPCQEECPSRSRAGPPSRHLQVKLSFGLCCWWSVTGVIYWHQCELICNQQRPEKCQKFPFPSLRKADLLLQRAWWKSGALGFTFRVQGGVSLTPLLWWETKPFLSI